MQSRLEITSCAADWQASNDNHTVKAEKGQNIHAPQTSNKSSTNQQANNELSTACLSSVQGSGGPFLTYSIPDEALWNGYKLGKNGKVNQHNKGP